MKRALQSLCSKKEDTSDSSRPNRSSRDAPGTSRVYEAQCIFCQKSSKYLKGKHTRENLVQCSELRSDDRIRQVATTNMDHRMLAIVSRELVAAEGHYHRSCYRSYTREEAPNISAVENDSTTTQYNDAEKQAYIRLFSYIRNQLFPEPEVIAMTHLTAQLVTIMNALGIDQVQDATKTHMRRNLEAEFKDALHIFPNDNGRLLVYPDTLTMHTLVKSNYSLKSELNMMKSVKPGDVIIKAALKIRNDIKDHEISQTWPPDVEHKEDIIPESVTQLFCTMLTGEKQCAEPSLRVKRLVSSFGLDLVYAISCGKNKPPKHILLPFARTSLTGNVELIKILNRLGHSVSYTQTEEIDTALCLQKIAQSGDSVPLPANIQPQVFTTLAFDNIDRLEETVSGEGTSHRVNGIAIQTKGSGFQPAKVVQPVEKTRQEHCTWSQHSAVAKTSLQFKQ